MGYGLMGYNDNRRPSAKAIADENGRMRLRQQQFRLAAEYVAAEFTEIPEVQRVVLFAHRPLTGMDKDDRVRACYLHTCLKYVTREYMTNASLRQRFGIEQHNSALASRIIADTMQAKLIRLYDPEASGRYAKYVPIWA